MKKQKCKQCGAELQKDWIALHKKLLNPRDIEFYCISCIADVLGCEVADLEVKIEEFKEEGCTLFR